MDKRNGTRLMRCRVCKRVTMSVYKRRYTSREKQKVRNNGETKIKKVLEKNSFQYQKKKLTKLRKEVDNKKQMTNRTLRAKNTKTNHRDQKKKLAKKKRKESFQAR